MNDTQVTKRKIGRMIAKNLIVMLVAVIVALTGVLAWFTNKTSADANGISVECKAPDGIEIAVVEKGTSIDTLHHEDFHEGKITLGEQDFLKDLSLSEVTSDGISFYKPVLKQLGGTAMPDTSQQWEGESDIINKSYISFDLYVRSKSEQTVFLEGTSKVSTVAQKLIGEHAENKSSLGDFSRDCIVGATRLSVVDYSTATPDRKLLWIPRPDLLLTNYNGTFQVTTDNTSNTHRYWKVTVAEGGVQTNHQETVMSPPEVTTSTKVNDEYVLGTKNQITSLSTSKIFTDEKGKNNVQYYCNHVTVNIWIEGEDDEARLALVDGEFKVNLDLSIK